MMNVSYADRGNVMHHYKLFGLVLSGIGLLTGSAAASLAPTPSTATAQSQWSPVVVLEDDAFDVNGESLATTSGGLTVASWGARKDGRYGVFFAVREQDQPWGQPRTGLPGRLTELVVHGSRATVGAVHDGRFLLRSLRPNGTWGATRTVGDVPVYPWATYHLAANNRGDLVVWWQRRDSTELAVRRAGQPWQSADVVPIGRGQVESVTLDDAAAVDVVYTPRVTEVARHRIFHVRRTPDGTWQQPTTLVAGDLRPEIEVSANDDGDIAVAWPQHISGDLWSLRLRYRPAGGGWGPVHILTRNMPESAFPALAMAASGTLSAAWEQRQNGQSELRFSRLTNGSWDSRQLLATGDDVRLWYGNMAGNTAGRTALVLGFGNEDPGVEVIRCPATGACRPPEHTSQPAYTSPFVDIGPAGTVKLIWAAGCVGEACYATSARYRDLTW